MLVVKTFCKGLNVSTDGHDRRMSISPENFNEKFLNMELHLCDLKHFSL